MVRKLDMNEIAALSVDKKIALAQAIWDCVAEDTGAMPLSEEQKQTLDRRVAELDANPAIGITWDEIKAHVKDN